MAYPKEKLAGMIDHTLLKKDATEEDILNLCVEAIQYGFKTVCIESQWLKVAVPKLKGSQVLPITVISFPEGNDSTEDKVKETENAVQAGAKEIDMVLNRNLMKAKNYSGVLEDIRQVVKAADGLPVKVILETSELTQNEKVIACALCKTAGAHFVKTSTGFSKSGATAEDVKLMREVVGPELGVKASGGVRTYSDAIKMIEAGATRLGTSASRAIVEGSESASGGY